MSSSRSVCQLAVLALLLTTAEAQASSKPSDAELSAITARGVLLAEYDAAAWQASDAVAAVHPTESRANLYIARKTDAGWIVDFGRLNQAGDKFLLAYEVVQTASPRVDVKSFDLVKEDMGWNLAAAADQLSLNFQASPLGRHLPSILPIVT
jgi:hypothetical protein